MARMIPPSITAELLKVAERYRLRDADELEEHADMISAVIEGGIILAKTLSDPAALGRQLMMQRSYIKLLFAPAA